MEKLQKHFHMRRMLLAVIALIFFASIAQAQLADSPWPMFMHDPQHTNQSQYAVAESLDIAWTLDLAEPTGIQPVIGEDGTIYLACDDTLYALWPDGTIKWYYNFFYHGPGLIISKLAIDTNGTIYLVAEEARGLEQYVFAISSKGKLKWKCEDSRKARGALAIAQDGTIYVGTYDSTLFAINSDGTLKWKYKTSGKLKTNPTIGLDGKVYVSSSDGYLVSIIDEGTSGRLAWKYKVVDGSYTYVFTPFLGPDGTIYAVGERSTAGFPLHAFDPDGTLKWQTQHRANYFGVGKDGTIYLSGSRGFYGSRGLFALNPEDGTEKWFLPINSGYLVIGDNEMIHTTYQTAIRADTIFTIDSMGNIIKKYIFEDKVTKIHAMIVDSDSSLYVTATIGYSPSRVGKLYCMRPPKIGKPDLVFSDVKFDPAFGVTPGADVKINFSVKDLSDTTSVHCLVSFYYDNESNFIDSISVYVPAGRLGHGEIIWDTQSLVVKEYDVFGIITDSDPSETDTINNEAHFSFHILPTIQSRIDAAQPGDTIWVDVGTYFENIVFNKDSLVLKSVNDPIVTKIDGSLGTGAVIKVPGRSGPTYTATIDGFTIKQGNNDWGGGIYVGAGSHATITNNIISYNEATWGGAISSIGDLNINRNIFINNRATFGGAIYFSQIGAQSLISHNIFIENFSSTFCFLHQSSHIVINNIMRDTGGATCYQVAPRFAYNDWWPEAEDFWSCRKSIYDISTDPLFVDEENYNYHLQQESPCINAGDPLSPRDPDGTRADMGVFYYDLSGQVGTVTGIVIDSTSGLPIWGAKVILSGSNDEDWMFTGNNGRFQFVVREGSDYSLQAFVLNYKLVRISDINVSIGGTQNFTLTLSPAPAPLALYPPRDLAGEVDSLDTTVVNLQWEPPREVLSFDDGIFEYVLGFNGAGREIGVGPFGPVTHTSTLDIIKIAFNGERAKDSILVSIWIDTTGTLSFPDTTQLKFNKETTISEKGGFQNVDMTGLEIVLKNNWHYYVSVEQKESFPMQIAVDEDAPDGNAFIEIRENNFGFLPDWGLHGVFAIRSVISSISQSQGVIMLAKAENFSNNITVTNIFTKEEATSSNESLNMASIVTKRVSAPSLDNVNSNLLLKAKSKDAIVSDSLLGYKIYRSLNSPVALTDSNRVNPNPVDKTTFSDTTLVYDGTYYYAVTADYTRGESAASNEVFIPVITSVEPIDLATLPKDFSLDQNYPNPFNPATTIKYQLPKPSEVTVKIFNINGQLVKTLVEQKQLAGFYSITWNGKDETEQQVTSGVYLYQIRARGEKESFVQTRKMVLVR